MIEKRRNLVFRFLPGLFLSGLLLLSGCSQDDVSGIPAGSRAIDFRAQGGMSSLKATTASSNFIKSFVVSAHYSEASTWTAAADYLLRGVTVYRGEDNKLAYSPQAYFPTATDGSVEFFAYSPSSSVSRNVKPGYGLNEASTADQTITYKVPAPNGSVTVQEDFLVAYKNVEHANYKDPVPLQFRHALSRILVSAKSELEIPIAITGLTLRNLYTEGTLDLNKVPSGDDENGWPYKSGAEISTTGDYVKWGSPDVLDNFSYSLPASGVSVGADYASVVGVDQGIFVLPQTTNGDPSTGAFKTDIPAGEFGLEIAYTINGVDAPEHAFVQFGDLNDIASTGVTFETGRQYVLNLSFGSGSGTGGGGGGSGTDPDISIGAKISFSTLVDDFDGPIDAGLPPPPAVFTPVPVIWSQSNVYFAEDSGNEGWLTFSETDDHNLYQGVYFKWGSLVGVSAFNGFKSFKESYLFIPASNGKYHKVAVANLDSYSGDSDVESFIADLLSGITWYLIESNNPDELQKLWNAVPYVKETDVDVSSKIPAGTGAGQYDDYGLTHYSADPLYATYRGDICRYLADKRTASSNSGVTLDDWRLPTSREFGASGVNGNTVDDPDPAVAVGDYTTKWRNDDYSSGTFTDPGSGNVENGTYELSGNHSYTLTGYLDAASSPPLFPASGGRDLGNGDLGSVGYSGYYWSSSAYTGNAYNLCFYYNSVDPNFSRDRTVGQSVRCVRL